MKKEMGARSREKHEPCKVLVEEKIIDYEQPLFFLSPFFISPVLTSYGNNRDQFGEFWYVDIGS